MLSIDDQGSTINNESVIKDRHSTMVVRSDSTIEVESLVEGER
jgi:hypothetical protein